MTQYLIPTWHKPWTWHLPWWRKDFDPDFNIYNNAAGFGPFQFRWYSS